MLLQVFQPAYVVRFDEGLRDIFVRLHATETPDERLAVIDIDERAMQEIGPWPWPRAKVADLIEILMIDHGARKIALDIVFPKRGDPMGDERLALLLTHLPITKAQVLDYTKDRNEALQEGLLSRGPQDPAGQKAVNYRTEPVWYRLGIAPDTPFAAATVRDSSGSQTSCTWPRPPAPSRPLSA